MSQSRNSKSSVKVPNDIPYTVIFATSESKDHPSEELNNRRPDTCGWQTARKCTYPQSLVLRLKRPAMISRISVLSHESKIAQKVRLFIASVKDEDGDEFQPSSFEQCPIQSRLGSFLMDSNQKNGYQERQLINVDVNSQQKAFLVKFDILDCWRNACNPYDQIGIIGIKILGNFFPKQKVVQPIPPMGSKPRPSCQSRDSVSGQELQTRLNALAIQKQQVALQGNFHDAAPAFKALSVLYSLMAKWAQVEGKMQHAVRNEDFAKAGQLKGERDTVKDEVLRAIDEVQRDFKTTLLVPRLPEVPPQMVPAPVSTVEVDATSVMTDDSSFLHQGRDRRGNSSEIGNKLRDIVSAAESVEASLSEMPRFSRIKNQNSDYEDEMSERFGSRARKEQTGYGDITDQSEDSHSENLHLGRLPDQEDRNIQTQNLNKSSSFNSTKNDGIHIGQKDGHALQGVHGYQDLPEPEEIGPQNIPNDQIRAIKDMLGTYGTKCLFSRNWRLRDATLTKLSQQIHQGFKIVNLVPALCTVMDVALSDNVNAVFLTAIIVLDECFQKLEQDENSTKAQKGASALAQRVMPILFEKLASYKKKVVEAATTSLLAMAYFECPGASIVAKMAMTQQISTDGGQAVYSRLVLVNHLLQDFPVMFQRIQDHGGNSTTQNNSAIDYLKSVNGFSHQDPEVRQVAKEIFKSVYNEIGEEVFQMVSDVLTPRQLEEYRTIV